MENGKVFFNTIEIKDWQQSLRKMELSLQELLILLIRLDVSIDSSVGMLEQLLFKSHSEVKSNVISVRFNSKSEKINFELDFKFCQILKSQSKLSTHNENLNGLRGI